eukprot:Colp12_sorted_trinity150504_noHs@27102
MKGFVVGLMVVALALQCAAHGRFSCPKPRDEKDLNGKHIAFDNTGNKVGPCGPKEYTFGFNGIKQLVPNTWQTLEWEESIAHAGSPFRISILDEAGNTQIVLLDHIPHNDNAKPIPAIEFSYVKYRVSVFIPDVKCDRCTIQLLYIMTDKTVKCNIPTCTYYADDSMCSGHTDNSPACAGVPSDAPPCKRENTCFSNYHSCFDVAINGAQSLLNNNYTQPANWPFAKAKSGVYGAEVGTWKNGWLQGVPAEFTTQAGEKLC